MRAKIYSTTKNYKFSSLVLSLFEGAKSLESLHVLLPENENIGIVNFENDNKTWFHQKFYKKINEEWTEFEEEYRRFIKNEVKDLLEEEFIFQARPTFRVQIPGNKSVGDFHRDYDYNHQKGEINFVVALTDMNDTSAIWAESEPDLGDYLPINVKKDQFFCFDGNMCKHGNKINETGKTRVSLDFRILPISMYDPQFSKASTGVKKKMIIGEYYDTIK